MTPTCLLFYIGFNRTLGQLLHHTFYFDNDIQKHLSEMFVTHEITENPGFYVSATSKTDDQVAPR